LTTNPEGFHDSQRFATGRPVPPIAPWEVQGTDAKQRLAEIAREVWRDRELATV
jgi:hypothetical protein